MSRNTLLRGVAGATLGLAMLGGTTTAFATQPASVPSSTHHDGKHDNDRNKHDNKCRISKDRSERVRGGASGRGGRGAALSAVDGKRRLGRMEK